MSANESECCKPFDGYLKKRDNPLSRLVEATCDHSRMHEKSGKSGLKPTKPDMKQAKSST